MIMKMLPMQVAAEVVAGQRLAIVYYPATLMDAFFFLDFDFLRVCCRLCSCAMHAQGKDRDERGTAFVCKLFYYKTVYYYRYGISSISSI